MENGHSQTPPSMGDARRLQWLPQVNLASSTQDEEGGLNLGQFVVALRRRVLVIAGVTTVVTSIALLRALTSTPTYQGNFEILTKPVTAENQVISSVPQTLSNGEKQEVTPDKGLDQTKLKLLKSPKLLDPIVQQLQLKYPDLTYDELAATLVVTPLPSSEILSVSYQDKDAEKVKAVLQQVSAAYLRYSLEERLVDVRQGIQFVDTQLPLLQQRVKTIQDQLQSFRQQYNLIDPESTGKQLSEQTTTIGQQRIEAQVKLNEARAIYADLNKQLVQQDNESVASSALRDNARYQLLLNQLLEVESGIAKESSLFREDAADIQVLRDQQKNLLPLLQREGQRVQEDVASKIRELEARNQILTQTEALLNQRIKQLSVISRQYTDIQQELKIATDNLNQFLTKREALRIDAGQKQAPWQLLAQLTDPTPSAANVKRSGLLGIILGILLGTGAALVLDKLSNILHTADDVKEAVKLPILGVIPFNSELEELENLAANVHKLTSIANLVGLMQNVQQRLSFKTSEQSQAYASSPFLEAFRSLYTNIRLLDSDTQIRSFVISSAAPGEGKSTTAIYLAQAAAALGQRVLLVDTDLRRPQLHNRLELRNTCGLSNLIASNLDYEQVIQRSPDESNLFILPAGQIPPDPTKLLSSQKMQSLIEQFKQAFDLVIYDMPPLIGLADAKLLAAKTDGIVMVIGLGKTKNSALTQALEGLKLSSVAVLGIVANNSKDYVATLPYHHYYAPNPNSKVEANAATSTVRQPER